MLRRSALVTDKETDQPSSQPPSRRLVLIWRIGLRVVLALLFVIVVFSLSYWMTIFFYGWLGHRPGPYLVHMTTVGAAMLLFLASGFIIGKVAEPRQHAFWQSLIDAIRQMAKGNFNVRIDVGMVNEPRANHPFRQLVHSINEMARELEQVEQMRQEFISNVSHEIQSPLTAILGFVEALKSGELTPDHRQHYLNIIETESKRLSRLSENLLKLTSLESGSHPFHPDLFRLDRQIREVVLSLEPLWTNKDIQIELSLKNVNIVADKDLLSQIWINLLTNAIKFTEPGGSLFISLEAVDNWSVVRFQDTGIGIKEADQHRIFERFYKADKARQRSVSGSGLGLTIVKKIIDIHHGEIQVESQFGTGTTFTVRLPNNF